MKAARNYTLGGAVVITPPTPGLVTLKLTLSNISSPVVDFATMKYNKKGGIVMVKDDGLKEDYTIGYAYLKGGVQAADGVTYPGVTFTDGAGKAINYKLTTAITTNADPGSGSVQSTWAQRQAMLAAGFEMANHTRDHGNPNRYLDVKAAEKTIYDNLGIKTRALVVPTNDEGYANVALADGYSIIGTQGAFDDFTESQNGSYGIYWGGRVNTRTFNYQKLLFNRYYSGEGGPTDWNEIKTLVNDIFTAAKNNTGSIMGHWFSHGLADAGSNTAFTLWKDFITYIKNHADNNDTLWPAGMQEFTEYYETKALAFKSQSLAGNVLTVTIDLSNIPTQNRLRDMSLLVGGATISAIQVTGADSYTHNPTTGLVNLYIKNASVKSPYTDTAPPIITSITKTGSTVNITYSRAVTQSVFSTANGAAYTVSGNTVLSVTGSGANWSVNCQNAIASGATLTYRMQRGNAAGADSLKVPSYISYPIN